MSKSSVFTAYVFLAERKSSFIGSQLLNGLVGLFTAMLSMSSDGEPIGPINEKLQFRARCQRNDYSTMVAKRVIKCSLERIYLVGPYLKQCSLNPQERVLLSSYQSLKKKE